MSKNDHIELQEVQAQVQLSIERAKDLVSEAKMALGGQQPQARTSTDEDPPLR